MGYTVQALAQIAGVSARTLRYYDRIGLLRPAQVTEAGYRLYEAKEVDLLQSILFYKALGFDLDTIRTILCDPQFNREQALLEQREALLQERGRLDRMIVTIEKTIAQAKGGEPVTDAQKFEGFKKDLIAENERNYGAEIRSRYGAETVDASNARMMNLTQAQYAEMQEKSAEIQCLLEQAVRDGEDPTGETGKRVAQLHREWLGYTWGHYSREAHIGLGEMYVADGRFTAHYDAKVPGCAMFLCEAIRAHI